MNVFLMYPDRDFTPRRERPPEETALIQDLELKTLFEGMARGDKLLFEVAEEAVLSGLDSLETMRYRQEILGDCLRHPDVVRQIYGIPLQARESKRRHWWGMWSRHPSGILTGARQLLETYVEFLTSLKQIADEHGDRFTSQGFRRFFSMIQEELRADYIAEVREQLRRLRFRDGVLLSGRLGTANEGTEYILRRSGRSGNWIQRLMGRASPAYSYTLPPRDDAGARALSDLRDMGINQVANAVARSADHIDSFLNALQLELAFYVGCLNLAQHLAALGEPIVLPEPALADERRHSFAGLYDVTLALTMNQKVVGNDLNLDHKDLVIISGANQGGKTTFLRSIGLAQLMMQCGMFVPAQSFCANVCTGIFTHYKRQEDTTMESGKLDEELGRMSEIVDNVAPHGMVLLNESFAATNEREGSEIARQITSALLDRHIKVFYVTHLYPLANGFYETRKETSVFLRPERKADGERTFRLRMGRPLQTSYGRDVYDDVFGKDQANPEDEAVASQG
jgi:hypothetical protein